MEYMTASQAEKSGTYLKDVCKYYVQKTEFREFSNWGKTGQYH